jgi:putative transposase
MSERDRKFRTGWPVGTTRGTRVLNSSIWVPRLGPIGQAVAVAPKDSEAENASLVLPRKTRKRYEIAQQPRFLTFSCYQRLPLFDNDAIRNAFVDQLALSRKRLGFKLIAWVVMPDHVHLIVVPDPPRLTISMLLSDLKRPFAARILERWRELNAPILHRILDAKGCHHFWQAGGGYDRNLYTLEELLEKIEYCHANPFVRGLVEATCQWRWSSARWYAGMRDGSLAIDELI